MSKRYPGGIITKSPATPAGPYETGAAPGVWTLEQQMQFKQQGVWPLAGNVPLYVEDVFSTYLYTGNGSTQTITNNIDLSTKGGLVWVKGRNETFYHRLASSPGPTLPNYLASNATDAASSGNGTISAFTTTGFSVSAGGGGTNSSGINYCSWTFREQAKFFDVVTYTGTGSNTTIAHSLGSVPGCIIVKRTDTTANWAVYHRSLANTQYLVLNLTNAAATGATWWNSTTPTSSVFSVGTDASVNASGGTYVAYVFAHDAGGFGLAGTDNVVSCGSFTADGSGGCSVTLGYEPQWIMYKNTASDGWRMGDVMRGWSQTQWRYLIPNDSTQEGNLDNNPSYLAPTSTGFNSPTPGLFTAGNSFIYVAIRRGPMKVPTLSTTVFEPQLYTGSGGTDQTVTGPTNAFQ